MQNKYISPSFLIALRNVEFDKNLLRLMAKDIPNTIIFEACARSEITPEEGAYIMMLQRESNYWIVRILQDIFV